MTRWTNNDGLQVAFGQDQARETGGIAGEPVTNGPKKYMVADLKWDELPGFTADLDNDGTNEAFDDGDNYIPAGSFITGAWVIGETTFVSGGSTTLDIGFYTKAGVAIDLDGIDAVIAKAALAGTATIVCNGALVLGVLNLTSDAYLHTTTTTGPWTAGKAKLVIEYIQVAP